MAIVSLIPSSAQDAPNPGDANYANYEHGFECGVLKEPENTPVYNKAPCEHVISGDNNTFIVLGRDRPGSLKSGYGGIGASKAGSIDIVAGRISSIDARTIQGSVDSSVFADASRIYISQRTDVDKNFSLAPGYSGMSTGEAAIAVKSDNLRFIARKSMKLIVGTGELKLSNGADLYSSCGIELIAKNNSNDLQPIPKGANLSEAIDKLVDQIVKLNGIIRGFMEVQAKFNKEIIHHTHISPFYGEIIESSASLTKAGLKLELGTRIKVDQQLKNNVYNLTRFKTIYLGPGDKNINSAFHKLN